MKILTNMKVLAILGFLAALVGAWPAFVGVKNFASRTMDSYMLNHIGDVLEVKMHKIDSVAKKKSSYRALRAEMFGVTPDSVLVIDKQHYIHHLGIPIVMDQLKSMQADKIALMQYLSQMSRYLWDEMGDAETFYHKGVQLKKDTNNSIIYHWFENDEGFGFMFEAYKKGSCDCYMFEDSYGTEREAIKQ